jgi:hypothetical protein
MYAKKFYHSYSFMICLNELNNVETDYKIVEKYASVKSSEITPELIKEHLSVYIKEKYLQLMTESKMEYGPCIYCRLSSIATLSKRYELVHVCDIHEIIHKIMPINEYLYINLAEFQRSQCEIKVSKTKSSELDFDFIVKPSDNKFKINPNYVEKLYAEYMIQKNKLNFDQFLVNKAISINGEKLIKIFVDSVKINIMKSEELLCNILSTNENYLDIPELNKLVKPDDILLIYWSTKPGEKNNLYILNQILAVCATELIFTTTWA